MVDDIVRPAQMARLTAPREDERKAMLSLERGPVVHRKLMHSLDCMNRLEVSAFSGAGTDLAFPIRIAAWNLERCYFPEQSAALLAAQGPHVVLLSEVDNGMARTGQRHTSSEIADRLQMSHSFGVEFLELELGGGRERQYCEDDFNLHGFHGNALLAKTALHAPVLIRLDDHGHWFGADAKEARVGGRCAIAAIIPTVAGPMLSVSVHLESNANGPYRAEQMDRLFNMIDEIAGDIPVVIGGDLNTGLADEGDFEKEGLFELAYARQYERHSGSIDEMTTRASMISPEPRRKWKLDWFLTRGVNVSASKIVPALSPEGEALSDHELIILEIDGFAS